MGISGGVGNKGKEDGFHDDAWRGQEQEDHFVGSYFVALCERMLATIDNSMPRTSFHDWLQNRSDQVPNADRLATLITQAGAAGISRGRLRKVVGLSWETLQDLLKSLVATGLVVMLKVGGEAKACRKRRVASGSGPGTS